MSLKIGIAVLFFVLLAGCQNEEIASDAVGMLESTRVELSVTNSAKVAKVLAADGQLVEKDAIILTFEDEDIRQSIKQAQAVKARLTAALEDKQRGTRAEVLDAQRYLVQGAEQQWDFAKKEYQRVSALADRKLVSSEKLDQAKSALDQSAAQFESAKARLLELKNGTVSAQIRQAEAAVDEAQASIDLLAWHQNQRVVRAPQAGRIDKVLYEVGEQPPAGAVVAVMLADQQAYARVYISEVNRIQWSVGKTVYVKIDGLTQLKEGRVRWISSEPLFTPYYALTRYDRGHLSYVAEIDIKDTIDKLPNGLPVEVYLEPLP